MSKKTVLLVSIFIFTLLPVEAQWAKRLKGMFGADQPSQEQTALGLKEALRIGAENAVLQTGTVDGYLKNEAIKILVPNQVQKVEQGLRFAGYGEELDEFVIGMNRAAEKAAPLARDILWEAVEGMSFQDAYEILRGGDTAATDYFHEQTQDPLTEAFLPIVQNSMSEVGVTRTFQDLSRQIGKIPFMNMESFDLDQYVVKQALNGLFHVLGEEERKIRTDPAARVTDLLKEVFGSQ